MQNIKGFKPSRGTAKSLANFGEAMTTIQFLESEGGLDWYECQALFADDTIKIMYDQNGVIVSVVDAPVPERGNTYAVSMFFPLNMSVAEVESLPEGFKLGAFIFDGVKITPRPVPEQTPAKPGTMKYQMEKMRKEMAELKKLVVKK